MTLKKIFRILNNHFGFPVTINWGYSLFLCSLGLLIVFLLKDIFFVEGSPISPTSLTGYSLTEPLLVALALLMPVATLFIEKKRKPANVIVDSIGTFTGIGPLLLSLISGVGLMFIRVPMHNLFSWAWLRIGRTLIFPAFFFVNDQGSKSEVVLGYLTGTVIPALGFSLFFTGLLWACFRKEDHKIATLMISLFMAVFSLNFIDFLGIFVTGIWLCFLRDRTKNVWAPFFSLLGCGLSELLLGRFVKAVDITMVQVYSDIDSTFFYSSLPAFLVGVILLAFFAKTLNDFKMSYDTDISINGEVRDETPSIFSGVNLSMICAIIIFLILWIMVIKG